MRQNSVSSGAAEQQMKEIRRATRKNLRSPFCRDL